MHSRPQAATRASLRTGTAGVLRHGLGARRARWRPRRPAGRRRWLTWLCRLLSGCGVWLGTGPPRVACDFVDDPLADYGSRTLSSDEQRRARRTQRRVPRGRVTCVG